MLLLVCSRCARFAVPALIPFPLLNFNSRMGRVAILRVSLLFYYCADRQLRQAKRILGTGALHKLLAGPECHWPTHAVLVVRMGQ